ncbi:hypothetical protein GUITHDRAFT_152130 [Guillardia theta CCMP2712]|uniref:Uncharacterized protein n=1 Tax=Guillardia theta (strain CCMP2712) TaxID=905079 RepID=L1JG69_GUITC|nr:hypothetical protein GUITHDRAFT_152130 [Guillardia theta CCMP2712]EKX47496.1 hypothetical protein GUITHDRAFT_152130 [Guillardia theta CCMP2712]|eukprot:XP_005834476.1 hypothetical protein GUITHDRAFT_152130 [Guillardia theta CCMP2712]
MEEDLNTKSWNGSKLCILLGSTEDARRMMKELPFYLEGAATKLEAVGFDKEPDSEAAGQRGTSDAAQRQEESEGEWLEFTDLERITMEAASPSSQGDMQLVSELSAVIEEAASLNEAGTSEPIKLVLDKAVGNLHDTFYSPGSLEFMSLGEWAKMPTKRWTRVQGESKKARRGSAFSPRATAAAELEQEAESDDIERRSLSFLFIALSKFAEMHVLACSLKVDKKDRLRVEMREDDEEEEDMEEEQGEGEEEDGASPYRA